jgi:hypothetical protein
MWQKSKRSWSWFNPQKLPFKLFDVPRDLRSRLEKRPAIAVDQIGEARSSF